MISSKEKIAIQSILLVVARLSPTERCSVRARLKYFDCDLLTPNYNYDILLGINLSDKPPVDADSAILASLRVLRRDLGLDDE